MRAGIGARPAAVVAPSRRPKVTPLVRSIQRGCVQGKKKRRRAFENVTIVGQPPSCSPSPPPRPTTRASLTPPPSALTCVSLMWAILLPPVGVALRGAPAPIVLINLLFTMLGYLPGQIHAILTIAMMGSAEQAAAK